MKKEVVPAVHNNLFTGTRARRASTPVRRAPAARPPRLPAVRLDAYRACSGVVVCVGTDRVRGVAALRSSPGCGGSRRCRQHRAAGRRPRRPRAPTRRGRLCAWRRASVCPPPRRGRGPLERGRGQQRRRETGGCVWPGARPDVEAEEGTERKSLSLRALLRVQVRKECPKISW